MYTYITRGVCAQAICIDLEGDTVGDVQFIGGCNGNLKAISKLVRGMTVDQVAELLEGNTCGPKPTSCADQLVAGLREAQRAAGAIR
ncbi:TIGR03905 family TSCPD domain-containing protein [Adlercreutzia sp. ZJ138]|uniref:TIGR03905 family TSCPD domain-containing protein n=1 Tax=Adlercreutzia sp. ZJ138 TaxID=2709405 RepID=UPI0013EDCA06|nr:TIGR03905 family TSCPD domain-containing protein [Adlercreutzia sp. ZJ138]